MQFNRFLAASSFALMLVACGGNSESPKDVTTSDVPAVGLDVAPDVAELIDTSDDVAVEADAEPLDVTDIAEPPADVPPTDVEQDTATTDVATPLDVTTDVAADTTTPGACPAATTCVAGHCIPNAEQGQCAVESDCPGISSCNAGAVGGICLGCGTDEDCPGTTECTTSGACAEGCSSSDECASGRCATSVGYCVQKTCTTAADCPAGATCDDGACVRITCPNPCAPNPCTAEHRTICEADGDSFVCACTPGYHLDTGSDSCVPDTAPGCDAGFTCEAGRCVKASESFFQCAEDADCGGGLTCSPSLPSGQCRGCVTANDCPTGYDTCLSGFCLKSCISSASCHAGMACSTSGFCGQRVCAADSECGDGYRCDPDSEPRRCVRKTCP